MNTHKENVRRENAIVLGIAACGAGEPRWWRSDVRLIPTAYTRRLRDLAGDTAHEGTRAHDSAQAHDSERAHDRARAHRGRGGTPALPARVRGLPAIAIGTLDRQGLPPRSHQPTDTPEDIDRAAVDRTVEFGMLLVDALDAELAPGSATNPDDAAEEATTPA
jgi:hypothetical protein